MNTYRIGDHVYVTHDNQARQLAFETDQVPAGASVLFFSVEPEMLPGGAK